jgi:hypothetical protein
MPSLSGFIAVGEYKVWTKFSLIVIEPGLPSSSNFRFFYSCSIMRSFASLTAFIIAAVSLTAAAPAPVARLNARQFPIPIPIPGFNPVYHGLDVEIKPSKGLEVSLGQLSLAVRQPEGAPTAIANADAPQQSIVSSFESNPAASAAVASASAAAASIANEASAVALPVASSLPSVAARQLFPPLLGIAALEGAGLAAGLEGAALQGVHAQSASAPAATPTTHVRRENSNPFAAIEGFLQGQAQAQKSAMRAAESGFSAFVASETAEHGAASATPVPSSAAAKRQFPGGLAGLIDGLSFAIPGFRAAPPSAGAAASAAPATTPAAKRQLSGAGFLRFPGFLFPGFAAPHPSASAASAAASSV